LTDTVVTRRNASLVVDGPYRWVRHPFYLAFGILVIANTLVTSNWFVGLASGAAFASIVARTRIEERLLIARFGTQYEEYMRRTGRFLPRLFRASTASARNGGGGHFPPVSRQRNV
jgi:protein-S-isoprenylcysteine O-methyltransferase Ste14